MGRLPASGPDPAFPRLGERDRFSFRNPAEADGGLVGVGGNLSPGMLLSAYEQGIFPWFSADDPVLWHSPDPRFVLFPESLHVSRSMAKVLARDYFDLSLDRDFPAVIRACSEADRPGQDGTWITGDMVRSYTELHRLGWVHSCEARLDGRLVGGCYGIRLGAAFFGESMFSFESNASKAAFISLARLLFSDGVRFIDCQVRTDHLGSLGATEIPRTEFLSLLRTALAVRSSPIDDEADRLGDWGKRYPFFGREVASRSKQKRVASSQ